MKALGKCAGKALMWALCCGLLSAPVAGQDTMIIPDNLWAHRIVLRGDTVWFVAPMYSERALRTAAYVRSTSRWLDNPALPQATEDTNREGAPVRPGFREDTGSVAVVRAGLELIHIADTTVQQAENFPSPVYELHDKQSGRRTRLLIPNMPSNRRRMFGSDEKDERHEFDFGTAITTWVADRERVWFGMWAGMPEVEEAAAYRQRAVPEWTGGILEYDVATGRLTPLLHPRLRARWPGAMARAGDALFIGTLLPSINMNEGLPSALLRYRFTDSSWTVFRSDSSPLPGNFVGNLAGEGDLLFIAADSGLAVFDTRTAAWSVRWFDRVIRNDSVVEVMVPARPQPDVARDAAIALAGRLQETRLSALLAAVRQVDPTLLVEYVACEADCPSTGDAGAPLPMDGRQDAAAAALAHPALLPFLTRALNATDEDVHDLAVTALFQLGGAPAFTVLRTALASASIRRSADVAGRLAQEGDAAARAWLKERLTAAADEARRSTEEVRSALVYAARRAGDPGNVSSLLGLVRLHSDTMAMNAVLELGSLTRQRMMAGLIAARPSMWYAYLDEFTPERWADEEPIGLRWLGDPVIRSGVAGIARTALTRPDRLLIQAGVPADWQLSGLHTLAINILVRWGEARDLPMLIALFSDSVVDGFELAEGLVRLTGDDTAPKADRMDTTAAQKAALQQFWSQWWKTNAGRFRPATGERGVEAVVRWRARHGLSGCCN